MTAGLAIGSSPPIPKKASEHLVSRSAADLTPRGSEVAIASIPESPASDDLEKYDVNLLASDRDGVSPKPTQENLIENLLSLEAEASKTTTVSTEKETDTKTSADSVKCSFLSATSPTSTSALAQKALPKEDTDNTTTSKKPKVEEIKRGRHQNSVGSSSRQSRKLSMPVTEVANLMENTREIATQTFSEDLAPLFSHKSIRDSGDVGEKTVVNKKSDHFPTKSCGYLCQKHGIMIKSEEAGEVRHVKGEKKTDKGKTGNSSEVETRHYTQDEQHSRRSKSLTCGFIKDSHTGSSKSTRSVCEYLSKTTKSVDPKIKNKQEYAQLKTSHVRESSRGSYSQNPSAKRRKSVDSSVPLVHEHQQRANVYINKFEVRPNTFNIPTRDSNGFDFYPAALNATSHFFEKLPELNAISSNNMAYNAFPVLPKNNFNANYSSYNAYSNNTHIPLNNQDQLCSAINMPCNAFHPEKTNKNVLHSGAGTANPSFSYSQSRGHRKSKQMVSQRTESTLCEYLQRKRDKPPSVPSTQCNPQPVGTTPDPTANVHTSSKPHSASRFLEDNMDTLTHDPNRQSRKKSSPDILQILATHPKSQCQYLKNYQKFLLKQAAAKAIEKSRALEQSFSSMQSPLQKIGYNNGMSLDYIPTHMMNGVDARTAGVMKEPTAAEEESTWFTRNQPGTFSWYGEDMGPTRRTEIESQQNFMHVNNSTKPDTPSLNERAISTQEMRSWHPEASLPAVNMTNRQENYIPSRHTCEYLKAKSPSQEPQEGFHRRGNAATFSPTLSLPCSSRHGSPSEAEAMLSVGAKVSSDLELGAAAMVSTRRPICQFILKNQSCIEKIKETIHRERRTARSENEKVSGRSPMKGTFASPPSGSSANSDCGREDSMPQHLFQILMAVIVSYFLIEKETRKVS